VDENLVAVKGHQKAMSFAWSSCEVLPGYGSRIIELDCKHLFWSGDVVEGMICKYNCRANFSSGAV
jgi:hypothetical protein